MTHLDRQKLDRLCADLGGNTALIEGLIKSLRTDVVSLSSAGHLQEAEQARVVHRVTGSASMLVPQAVLTRLNRLESALLDGEAVVDAVDLFASELSLITTELESWISTISPGEQ